MMSAEGKGGQINIRYRMGGLLMHIYPARGPMPPPPMPQVIGNRSKHPAATFATLGRRTGFLRRRGFLRRPRGFLRRPFERRVFFRRRGFFRAKGTAMGSKPFL